MSVNGKYPEQLIAMVSKDMKADIKAEADRREISISQVTRERLERAEAKEFCDQCAGPYPEPWLAKYGGHWDTCPNRHEGIRQSTGHLENPETLAEYARTLAPDTEPDEVDGSLSEHEGRVARLKARGLL